MRNITPIRRVSPLPVIPQTINPIYERAKDYGNHKSQGKDAILESNLGARPLAKGKAEKGNTKKFLVRVTSIRTRLIDEDNLCEKYHVDCLRYAGLLPDDNPQQTKIEVCQIKATKGQAEETIVELFEC